MATIEIRYSAKCKDCKHLESYHRIKKNGEPYKNYSYRCPFSKYREPKNYANPKDYACKDFKYKYD